MKYYRYSEKDIRDILNAKDKRELMGVWNRINENGLMITCSACKNDYPYFESPVLKDDVWKNVTTYYNLHDGCIMRAASVPQEINASKIYKLKMLMNVRTSNTEVCVCRQCMEKALGHPLHESDLKAVVPMNKKIINELKMTSA